jgi:hypothetical protein
MHMRVGVGQFSWIECRGTHLSGDAVEDHNAPRIVAQTHPQRPQQPVGAEEVRPAGYYKLRSRSRVEETPVTEWSDTV